MSAIDLMLNVAEEYKLLSIPCTGKGNYTLDEINVFTGLYEITRRPKILASEIYKVQTASPCNQCRSRPCVTVVVEGIKCFVDDA